MTIKCLLANFIISYFVFIPYSILFSSHFISIVNFLHQVMFSSSSFIIFIGVVVGWLNNVFISQVNYKKKILPFLYFLFIYSKNNRRAHWCRGSCGQDIMKNGKTRWEMSHQPWFIKMLPRLSQIIQDTTRWLPELCTAKTV